MGMPYSEMTSGQLVTVQDALALARATADGDWQALRAILDQADLRDLASCLAGQMLGAARFIPLCPSVAADCAAWATLVRAYPAAALDPLSLSCAER